MDWKQTMVRAEDERSGHAAGRLGWLGFFCMATLAACGSTTLTLVNPDSRPGSRYQCQPGRECIPGSIDGPAEPGSRTELSLPKQCADKFHEITIVNADSSQPEMHVTCAESVAAPTGEPTPGP